MSPRRGLGSGCEKAQRSETCGLAFGWGEHECSLLRRVHAATCQGEPEKMVHSESLCLQRTECPDVWLPPPAVHASFRWHMITEKLVSHNYEQASLATLQSLAVTRLHDNARFPTGQPTPNQGVPSTGYGSKNKTPGDRRL